MRSACSAVCGSYMYERQLRFHMLIALRFSWRKGVFGFPDGSVFSFLGGDMFSVSVAEACFRFP